MMEVMLNAVKPPPEFFRLARAFRLENSDGVKDQRDWITAALRHLDPSCRRLVKQFLTDLLRQNPDEAELQELWTSARSNYHVVGRHGNDGVRTFLTMIRDHIE